MMTFCPEHPKWDHNPKFTPLSETTSIPTPFICRVPPRCYHSSIVLAINSSGWEKTPLLFIKMRIAFHVDHKFTLIFSFFCKWNGLLKMVNFFFLKTPKIWVDRTTLDGEKKEDRLTDEKSKIQATSEERVCALHSRKQAEHAPLSPLPPPLPSLVKIVDAPAGESVFKRPGTSRHILDCRLKIRIKNFVFFANQSNL